MKKTSTKKFLLAKPLLTVDVAAFAVEENQLKVLLVERKYPPFKSFWALPGGFIRPREGLVEAAVRELKEETGVGNLYLEQLYTFGSLARDSRGRVVTVTYLALVPRGMPKLEASTDATYAAFLPVASLPKLAFDHAEIITYALVRLRNKIQYTNVAWSLLPEQFTLKEIQDVYEAIWGRHVDKRNFRKKILALGILKELPMKRTGLRQRPASLYAFKTKKYVELKRFF